MNSRQRVLDFYSEKKIDRIPYSFTDMLTAAKYYGCSMKKFLSSVDIFINAQKKIIKKVPRDIIFTPLLTSFQAVDFGVELKYHENQFPTIKKGAMKLEEIIRKKNYFLKGHNFLLQTTQRLVKEFKNDHFIAGIILCPIDFPSCLFPMEEWFEKILFDRKFAEIFLEFIVNYSIEFTNKMIDAGIDLILIPNGTLKTDFYSLELIKDLLMPFFKKFVESLSLPVIMHHGGSRIEDMVEIFSEIENIIGLSIDFRDSFKRIREKTGDRFFLMGNMNCFSIDDMKAESIKLYAKNIIEERKNDDKYAFGFTGAGTLYNTSVDKLILLKDVIEEYGKKI